MPTKKKGGGRIKSQAQRRKFAQLLVEGKIDPEVYERWNRRAGGRKLPERVRPKETTRKTKARTTRRTTSRR